MRRSFTPSGASGFLFVTLLLFMPLLSEGQEGQSCAEKLKSAQALFNKGQTDEIPSLISSCLRSGFKREEQLAAFKLLIQTYLLEDKLGMADSAMLAFLKRNPEYQLSPTDHSSFVYLYNKFNVKPILQLGVRIGTNIPFLTFIDENRTSGELISSVFKTDAANLFLSAEAKFRISEKLELGAGAGYSQLKFTNIVGDYRFAEINYTESQKRIEIPISLTWDITTFGRRFTPYVRSGVGGALVISSKADASQIMTDSNNPNDRTGESLRRKGERTPVDIFLQAGGGMKFKIPRGYVFLEMRSNFGILQQATSAGDQLDLLESYYMWSDPRFHLNTFNINMGWTYLLYKPSKKKE